MPSPVTPGDIEPLLPAPGGSLCEKVVKNLFRVLPQKFYALLQYERNEDGTIADGFAADIRALGCFGTDGGTPGTGMLSSPVISASDGLFLDKIQVTWNEVANADSYDVFRNTSDSVTTAALIGTTSSLSFNDTTAESGITYYYWVKAKNSAGAVSAFSASDSGFLATQLIAVTDLQATQGYFSGGTGSKLVGLVWTPTAGAERWDIYRGDTDVFSAATLIDSSRVPFDNSEQLSNGPSPVFINNATEVLYYDQPPVPYRRYYYWVIARAGSGGSVSSESNSALGWAVGDGNLAAAPPAQELFLPGSGGGSGESVAGYVRAYLVVFGAGAGGAGANTLYGGGGGGAGPMITGHFNITGSNPKFRLLDGNDTARSAIAGNGFDGSIVLLQFAEDGVTWATIATLEAPSGGLFNASGSGAGGAGSTGTVEAEITSAVIKAGRAGLPGMGSKGGRSGNLFGNGRTQPANFIISHNGDGIPAGRPAGGGSSAAGSFQGGIGREGRARIFLYSS